MADGIIFNNDTPRDMQELIDILNKMSSKVSSLSENSNEQKESFKKNKSGSVSQSPTIADLKSYAGNLGLAVPAGFIMLHNDLEKLTGKKGIESSLGGSTSIMSTAAASAAGGAIGAAAGAAVGGLVNGLVGAFKPDSPGQKHIEELIDQMNLSLTLEDVMAMPGVKEKQAEGVAAYIKTYFVSQAAALATSEVLGSVGEGLGKAIAGVFTGIWKGFGGKEKTGLETITAALMDNLKAEDYINKPEIKEAQEQGVAAYVKTYFISQAASLATSETMGAIGEGAGKLVAGVFTGLWKGFGGKEKTGLEGLVNQIIDGLEYETVIQDPDVQKVVHNNFVAYLKTYFATQIASMALSETVAGITEAAGESVGGVLKGLFRGVVGAFGADTRGPLQIVADDVIASIKSEDFIDDAEVKEIEHKNVVAYLKTYFAMQIANMAESQAVEGVFAAAGESVGGLLKGLFKGVGEAFGADMSSPIQKIINELIKNINPEPYLTDTEVLTAEKHGIVSYLKTYFEIQANAMAKIDTASAAGEAKGSQVRSFFTSLFKENEESPFEKAINVLINDINPDAFKNSNDIKLAKEYGLSNAVKVTTVALGNSLSEAILDVKYSKNELSVLKDKFVNAVGNSITEMGNSLNVDITNNTKTIASSFDDTKIRNSIQSLYAVVSQISTRVGQILDKDNTTVVSVPTSGRGALAVAIDDLPQ